MGRRLVSHVHVYDANGDTHVFGPDDEVPAEYAAQIGDHAWVGDGSAKPETAAPVQVVNLPSGDQSPQPDQTGVSSVKVPPRGGPGSGRDAWVAYAEAHGVQVTDEMRSRDDIVAAVEAAGVPVE